MIIERMLKHIAKIGVQRWLIVAMALLCMLGSVAPAYADSFDEQIKALQAQVDRDQAQAASLRAQANTLQNQINVLNAQKAALQAQIDLNNAKHDQLLQQIADTEKRLANEKTLLGLNLRAMYLEGQVSTLEMVASSKSISDFIDKQEARNKIRDQVSQTIGQIKKTQIDLNNQKTDLEHVLADQNKQKEELAATEKQQATLLAETQGQEAAYQNLVSQNNSQIASLRAQQAAANRAASGGGKVVPGDPGHGGYPNNWNNAPMDYYTDPWGMYTRECVSYTAFRVSNSGRYMPYWGGRGNANQWPSSAHSDGITTGSTPKVGSVAISMAGPYGHAMYVEAILDGGANIYVSQYNYGFTGEYSEMTRPASGLIYIYF